jgi:hypothetical protein
MERHQNDDKMVGGLGEMKNTAAGWLEKGDCGER